MMESSEQLPLSIDLNPSEDSFPEVDQIVNLHPGSPDDSDTGSVIDLAGLGSATEHYIELNGQQLLVQHSGVDREYFVLEPEEYTIQQNSGDDSIAVEEVSPDLDPGSPFLEENERLVGGGGQMDQQVASVGNLTIKEVSNSVAYVPETFLCLMSSSENRIKQEKLVAVHAATTHVTSAGASPENTEDNYDLASQIRVKEPEIDCLRCDGAYVVSAPMYPASETEEDTATDLVSEHDSKSGGSLIIADHEGSEEPTVEEKQTSFAGISIPRSLDNTFSVIHTTSTAFASNDINESVENSNDIYEENKQGISLVDNERSQDSTSDLPAHFNHDSSLNKNKELLNQDDDSELSQTCGLDLTKESTAVCSPHDNTLSAVEHTRSRYGIMDSLLKDKNKSYCDTKATYECDDVEGQGSDGMEDTLYSSIRSTNVTEDGEYINENNSNSIDCNTVEEAPKLELSNEKLNPEPENSSLLDNAKSIENCDKDDDESYRHSDNVNINYENEDLLCNKNNGTNFLSVNDNSNSKNSFLSDIVPSPQMLNAVETESNSRQSVENAIDTLNFDDASMEAENDSDLLVIQEDNNREIQQEMNSKSDAAEDSNHIDNDKEANSQKNSFHIALSNVLDKEENAAKEMYDMEFDGSADLFNNSGEIEDNDKLSEGSEEKPKKKKSFFASEHQEVPCENDLSEVVLDKEKNPDESSLSKINVEEDMMDHWESLVKAPKRVYFNKRKLKQNKDAQKQIDPFSCADLAENCAKSPLNVGVQKESKNSWADSNEKIAIEKDITLIVQSRVSATHKRKQNSPQALQGSCKIVADRRSSLYFGRTYPCVRCSFIGKCVDSILCHYKYCPSSLETFQYSAKKANDPNKRQLLRGDGACENENTSRDKTKQKRIRLDNSNKCTDDRQDEPNISLPLASIVNDTEKDNDDKEVKIKKAKLSLKEKDPMEKKITNAPRQKNNKESTDDLDIEKVMECIWQNQCNEHVLKLYRKAIPSKRHALFEENESAKELENLSWFGPLKSDPVMQLMLYDHFYELYKEKVKRPSNASYIYKVWIPEGIIKAISLVNNIKLDEAQLTFLKRGEFGKDSSSL